MKTVAILLLTCIVLSGCQKDEGPNDNNPYLLSPLVDLTLNLNLPEYNALNFPGNSIIITQQGLKGIVIYNVNNDFYTAFELSDPNHVPSSCSRMEINGTIASCPCPDDDNEYNIVTGQHAPPEENLYPMQQYFAERNGNIIRISN